MLKPKQLQWMKPAQQPWGGGYLITNTSTLTVTNLPSDEEKFAAYKILDAFYNEQTNEISYEFTTDFKAFLAQRENYKDLTIEQYSKYSGSSITDGEVESWSSLAEISAKYATYVRANNITGTAMNTSGTSASTTISAGSYLVLPTTNKYIYAVMVGNAEFSVENGEWKISSPTIVAKSDELILETYVSSYIFNDMQDLFSNMDKLYMDKSFDIGNEYNYVFRTNTDYPYYTINQLRRTEILFDDGIESINIDDIKIFEAYKNSEIDIDSEGILYYKNQPFGTLSIENKKIIIEYEKTSDGIDNIIGFISTKLNENAILGPTGNKITTKFYYANDPYDPNSEAILESANIAYTYGIELQNYGEGEDKPALNNSVFEVYSDSELTTKVGEITIIDGIGTLKGVADGTYYLKQTKAPTGYKLSTDTISFEIDTTKEYTSLEIFSAEAGFLPSTGGIGTIIYTLIGLVVVGISTLLIVKYRKRAYQI